mmetsp:Transcript_31830/g.46826  ORF Transcript_31830/g.46826 Transcript_31830/m.46826 type:complete len:86 (-) Transcript_31830:324-581(-)
MLHLMRRSLTVFTHCVPSCAYLHDFTHYYVQLSLTLFVQKVTNLYSSFIFFIARNSTRDTSVTSGGSYTFTNIHGHSATSVLHLM